jgi:ABC-type multidrug transport system ATPase subunit
MIESFYDYFSFFSVLLSRFSFQANPGEICAVMGPSGSGKSSLLNVLAGRSTSIGDVHVEGMVIHFSCSFMVAEFILLLRCLRFFQIKVGGISVNPVSYRKNIAYVMQDDFLMPTATPREAFGFSARLRLPSFWTEEKIKIKVESLLQALGIQDCADTIVGGEMIKGLSGGQRKRTAVGIELVTDPSVSLTC